MRLVRLVVATSLAVVLLALPATAAPDTAVTASPTPTPVTAPATIGTHSCADLFPDVTCGRPFFNEIGWMTNNEIATGYADGTFAPDGNVSRQAMAAFLYRDAGGPSGPFPAPPFSDVTPGHPFYDEISWMADEGITTGFGDGTFRSTDPVSRQAMAAFLYRAEGSPPGPFPDPAYTDVAADHLFALPIWWMADAGVTTGYIDGTFQPAANIARQAMAAFLFRLSPYGHLDLTDAHRCEFLGGGDCLLPFPSNHFTVPESEVDRPIGTSGTSGRVNLDPESMPVNTAGVPMDPTQLNMNDGFSPGQMIVVQVPGIDLEQSDAPTVTNPQRSLEPDSPIIVLNQSTGEPIPVFAELDANAADPAKQALIIRPLVNYDEGTDYAVSLRNLRNAAGELIPAPPGSRAVLDAVTHGGDATGVPAIDVRIIVTTFMLQDLAEVTGSTFDQLVEDHYMLWDFTVASEQNLSERLLHLRDDAFTTLGDDSPAFTVTSVEHPAGHPNIATRAKGTFEVPRYLDGTGATGSTMTYGSDGLPEAGGVQTANFDCIVPHSATAGDPARVSLFGHGLLGTASGVTGFAEVAQAHNTVFCGTDWIGMAEEDLVTTAGILQDLSKFSTLPDRGQQGILNFLFLGRLLIHEDGFASDPAFQDAGGTSVLDDTRPLVYVGGSQGGIMGGALTAVAQDFTRAVLAVPGQNYSTMLRRSSNWPTFEGIMQIGYPDELDQTIGIGLIQMLWDRAESNGYSHHLTDDPLAGTPAHEVLLFEAFGDHQVANLATEAMARTMGVHVRQPALGAGRSPIPDQFWGIPAVPSYPFAGSVLVVWDWGTSAPPLTNTPPTTGEDPHGWVGNDDEVIAQSMLLTFLETGTLIDVCAGLPCTSPP